MRVPIKWLSEYVPIVLPIPEIAHRLTMAGLEVTGIQQTGEDWENVVVGDVVDVTPHPDADRLRLVRVDTGAEQHEVVCGAPNVAKGQRIAYARIGANLRDGHTGEPKKLKKAKIRGVVSVGMVCSERELGLSDEHEGILVLDPSAEIGAPLAEVLGDTVLIIDMKPNRADGLSILGVARDVAVLTGVPMSEPPIAFPTEAEPIEGRASVRIEAPHLCRRFTLAIIEDISIGPSPSWMQERLSAAGMRPINNVVDITNYVMLEFGQPIHAFDYDKVRDHAIVVREADEGERLVTLDGQERRLTKGQLLITDPGGPIAVAGVMGGLETEVTDSTKTILLEVANFDPVSIRRTAMALKLPSEASKRFAWGVAPELAPITSRRVTQLLVQHASGRAAPGLIDAYPSPEPPVEVRLPAGRVPRVLGLDPPRERIEKCLTELGFEVRMEGDDFVAVVPYWRRDVRYADDLVEEVARIVGYESIPIEPLEGRVPPRVLQPTRELKERVRDVLVGAGMQEVITYPLTSMEVLSRVQSEDELGANPPLRVVNPLNEGEEHLRTSLRGSLLRTIAHNLRFQKSAMAMFEAARVYLPSEDGAAPLPIEQERVVGAVAGFERDRYGRVTEDRPVDFFHAKACVEALGAGLHIDFDFEAAEPFGLMPGRSAEIRVDGSTVGVIGQVHPFTAESFGISSDVFLFDIDVDRLVDVVSPTAKFSSFSRYPAVEEALSLVVEEQIPSATVMREVIAHPLVASGQLFDEYRGSQVPPGKKSLSISVSFQAPDRTLTDKDVSKARKKILARLSRTVGAELRS